MVTPSSGFISVPQWPVGLWCRPVGRSGTGVYELSLNLGANVIKGNAPCAGAFAGRMPCYADKNPQRSRVNREQNNDSTGAFITGFRRDTRQCG